MSISRKISTSENKLPEDSNFNELFRFIKAALAEPNENKRVIKADAEYSFTVRVIYGTGEFVDQIVRIPAGQKLYFFRNEHDDKTNINRFMFDEEDHSWIVQDAARTGAVTFRDYPIGVMNGMAHGKFNGKISEAGLSLK